MKYYNVYYLIRVDGDEVEQFIDLFANNAKEACELCKEFVKEYYGQVAIRPVAKRRLEA